MKGLQEYITAHGEHLTVRLVEDTIYNRWSSLEVENASKEQVYYNVTQSTLGDVTFLVNVSNHKTLRKRLSYAFQVIGDVDMEGVAFYLWVLQHEDSGLDLREYV